jgi:hypothetical protein
MSYMVAKSDGDEDDEEVDAYAQRIGDDDDNLSRCAFLF